MKSRTSPAFVLACLLLASRAFAVPGLDAPVPIGAYLNGVLPTSPPGTATGWTTENAFPALTFIDPLWLTPVPGTDDLLLVGKNGQLWRFPDDPAVTQSEVVSVLDWASQTQSSEDQGFYSLVFHPEFGNPGSPGENSLFVCYNHKPALAGADSNHSYWRVSRFTWLPATGTIDPLSEFVLINQYDRCRWHNGGAMFFDNQGFLNIAVGDGGDSSQGGGLTGADGSLSRTQTLTKGLFSGIFRIDVDNDPAKSHPIRRQPTSPVNTLANASEWPASFTQGYGIPNDNPWQDPTGGLLEEYVVLGLRSPHTAHFDAAANEIWVGDVGEGAREEMSRLVIGDNAQWGYREGTIAGPGTQASPPIGTDTPPAIDYPRSVGTCIIGGMRYRGAKWNSLLGGRILFGDHVRGRIWSADVDGAGVPEMVLLTEGFPTGSKAGLANFCTDDSGEIYLMCVNGTNQPGGTIRKLAPAAVSNEPPQFLSQTGLFTNLATLSPAPGFIPYDVANPLWSDGAAKFRWIAVPNDGIHDSAAEKIGFDEEGSWTFPPGTVLVKHFEIATDERNPALVKRLETRFLVCTEGGGKYGVTYKWNEAGTDAELLSTGFGEDYTITHEDGSTTVRNWDYPSRSDCLLCHNANAGQALGVRTAPMRMEHFYPATGRTADQIETFNSLGMFDRSLAQTEIDNLVPARAIEDETAPIEHRVRSYLDSNCAHCHQPGGTVEAFDARLGTPLHLQGLVNAPIQGHYVLEGGSYLKPGHPDLSAIEVRLMNVGNGDAMPPLAKNAPDIAAIDLVASYINSLDDSEFATTPSPMARYVRLTALSEVNGNPWTSVAEFTVLDGDGSAIPHSEVSVSDFDSEETSAEAAPATNASDGDPTTIWHTSWAGAVAPPPPHHLTLDLGVSRAVGGYTYLPRQSFPNGRIKDYQVDISDDGLVWTPMDAGTWANDDEAKTWSAWVGVRKARCSIAGPSGTVGGNFDVTVVFDQDVTDFTSSDLAVTGGSVVGLRGSGYYYVATIAPAASEVTVGVPEDAAASDLAGNFASESLAVNFVDTIGPVASFVDAPAGVVSGPFTLVIEFTEEPVGFSASNLTALHASLSTLSGSGTRYEVVVTPETEGSFSVTLSAAGITDAVGNPMETGLTRTFSHSSRILFAEAEAGVLTGDMVVVTDAAASGGAYIWLPDELYPGNYQTLNPAHSATYSFVLPRSGNWTLEGLIRSADASSDSFWATIDGGTSYLWDTNQGSVGSTDFSWDALNNRTPAIDPVSLPLAAGPHSVVIHGRDDGTRLDALRFTSERPLATLTGPLVVVRPADISVNVGFSKPVTGLDAGDFLISGGTAGALAGSGDTYTLSIVPNSAETIVSLPEDAAADASGFGNHHSDPLAIIVRSAFDQWAEDEGLGGIAPLSDENGNGVPALLEYLLNLDPRSAATPVFDPASGPAGLPNPVFVSDGGGQRIAIEFPRNSAAVAAGYRYIAQFTSNMATWVESESGTALPMSGGWEHVTIQDPAPPPGGTTRCVRLKVIAP